MCASFPYDKQVKEKDGVLKGVVFKGRGVKQTKESNRWPEALSGSRARDNKGKIMTEKVTFKERRVSQGSTSPSSNFLGCFC